MWVMWWWWKWDVFNYSDVLWINFKTTYQ